VLQGLFLAADRPALLSRWRGAAATHR
jgi:hypothetical protein